MKKQTCCLLLSTLFLFSCGGENGVSSSSSSSKSIVEVNSFAEALGNTSSSYAMYTAGSDGSENLFQVVDDSFFYYSPYQDGYICLDSDPNYYHAFSAVSYNNSIYDFTLDVHGRNYAKKDKESCFYVNFMDILEEYADDFTLSDKRTYSCSVSAMADDLLNYFQNRIFAYATYFEAKIGDDGRIASFSAYEKDESSTSEVGTVIFHDFSLGDFAPYTRWAEAGKKINLRIFDLKTGYSNAVKYNLCYQNQEVSVEGTVSSFDEDGSYYISAEDDENGYIGINVKGKEGSENPSINDRVLVTGTVKQNSFVAYLEGASFTKLGEEEYYPYFEEESIASSYGGGYYAAALFSRAPYFAGSIYSTYAYISSLPETVEEDEDAIIPLICPSFQYTDGSFFQIGLILKKEMGSSSREKIIEDLQEYGIYGESGAIEVSFERFIVSFSMYGEYLVNIVYGSESSYGKSLSPEEKVEKDYGIPSFPFPEASGYSCCHFGGSSGNNLEDLYEVEGKKVGIYYYASSLTSSDIEKTVAGLSSLGFIKKDVIKDGYRRKHTIYGKDEVKVDYYVDKNSFDGSYSLNMWIYEGEIIHAPYIEEIIKEKIPYFDASGFLRAAGTDSASYGYYALPNFAGIKFASGSYLHCVTIDMTSDGYRELRNRYINEEGYKSYRNEDGSLYIYKTRGQNHYVFYKDIEGSDEKVFLDMASYPTSDYTFLNHSDFSTRIELYIYKGSSPISPVYNDSLKEFFLEYNELNSLSDLPEVSLPANSKVEIVYALPYDSTEVWNYTTYGYYMDLNCFIYTSNVNAAYEAIVKALKESGFELYSTSEAGNDCYFKEGENSDDYGSYILLMKKAGYIRMLDGIGGVDF